MDNKSFAPGAMPSQPQPQPVPPQPLSQPSPQPVMPSQPQVQPQPVQPSEPIQPIEPAQPSVPVQSIEAARPSEPIRIEKKKAPLVPIIIGVIVVIAAIVAVVILLLSGSKVSISKVRKYCEKNNYAIVQDTNDDPKAEYIQCTAASGNYSISSITYTVLYDGLLKDNSDFSSVYTLAESLSTKLEDTDEYKKFYLDASKYGGTTSGYIIVEDKAYITITGDDDAMRAALIEIGYPDRNWVTKEEGEQTDQQALQRDIQRRNDMARLDTSLVQYQTNHPTQANNLPSGPSFYMGSNYINKDSCGTGAAANVACVFVRDYMNIGSSDVDKKNEFRDPDGEPYSVYITENWSVSNSITLTPSGITGSKLISSEVANGYTIGGDDVFSQHIIYIVPGGKCSDSSVVKSERRHFAILYLLEDQSVYCIDDQ